MIALLLSAALLAGTGTSTRLGETSPSLVMAGDVSLRGWHAEGLADTVDKIHPGDGWLAHAALDYAPGMLGVGVGYSHRHTSAWTKNVLWVRGSLRQGPLMLLAEIAPDSPLMEAKAEARLRLRNRGPLRLEGRFWLIWAKQTDDGYAHGIVLLAGIGR